MKYLLAAGFFGALLQGNLELALFMFLVFVIAFVLGDIFRKIRRHFLFKNYCHDFSQKLGLDWVFVLFKNSEVPDPAALVFHKDSKVAHLLRPDGYGSLRFCSSSIGKIQLIVVEEFRKAEVRQPCALIRLESADFVGKFIISGEFNWKALCLYFPELKMID